MPWEKSFDVDETLDKATRVFWSKGYEATSMSDLLDATGINKGSLYNTFKNKKTLFVMGLLKYDRDHRKATLDELSAMSDPVAAIGLMFDGMIDECASDTDKKGCLLVNTALELPHHDKDVADIVKAAMEDIEEFFSVQIRRGQQSGQLSGDIDAVNAAKALLSSVIAIRVMSRGVFDAAGLDAIRTHALNVLTQSN